MKKLCLLCLSLLLTALLCACGQRAEITISDRGVVTVLETRLPKTVSRLLDEAELSLREGDEVSPGPDTLISAPCEILLLRESVVQLTVDGVTRTLICQGGTVGELLAREGVVLEGDLHANLPPETWLRDGLEIFVADRFAVTLCHDGLREPLALAAATVGEALVESGIRLSALDRVSPAPETLLSQGMTITVSRVYTELQEQEEPLGFTTVYERDESLAVGEERVETAGENGLARVWYLVTYVDGAEESREAIRSAVLREPVNELIRTGPKDPTQVYVVSKKAYYDCDGSGHGYYEISYSDGSVEYERF